MSGLHARPVSGSMSAPPVVLPTDLMTVSQRAAGEAAGEAAGVALSLRWSSVVTCSLLV